MVKRINNNHYQPKCNTNKINRQGNSVHLGLESKQR